MASELLAGVTFFEAADSGHTATLLAAISEVLAARHDAPGHVHGWRAAVPKSQADVVAQRLTGASFL